MINENQFVPFHRDANNCGVSCLRSMGVYDGGLFCQTSDAERAGQIPSDAVECETMLSTKGGWTMFDASVWHGVSEVQGRRLSLAYFTPVRHDQIDEDLHAALESHGFPVHSKVRFGDDSLPIFVADGGTSAGAIVSSVREKGKRGKAARSRMSPAALLSVVADSASACGPPSTGSREKAAKARRLRESPARRGECGVKPGTFQPDRDVDLEGIAHSDFRRFYRQLLSRSSRPCAAPRLAAAGHDDILPMPLPFPSSTDIETWPRSPRRLARIRRHQLRRRWCNHLVSYLSWTTLGKPGGMTADPRLLAGEFNQVQLCVRDRLWQDMGALVRLGAVFEYPGRGRISSLLEELSCSCGTYHSNVSKGTETLTLSVSNMALPVNAAVVQLVPPIVLPEISKILHTEGALDLSPLEHPKHLPPMFMLVQDWASLAKKLLESGLAHAVPYAKVPRSCGRSVASGLFGVSKPGSDLRRVIVDRRRKNACERSLREAACAWAVEEQWGEDRLLAVVREMTLPHPMQFKDLFAVTGSQLHIDTKDAKDYFYLMALPDAQLHSTPIGWPLRARELEMTTEAGDEMMMLCLRAPAMGSKHSMEIAQATHHGVMRQAGVLEREQNWMTLGWPPPQSSHWVGCYCDDLALVSMCWKGKATPGVTVPQRLLDGANLALLAEGKAEAGYTDAKFVVKREKCEYGLSEGTIWGSELSSRRLDVGCPTQKVGAIAHVTWRMVKCHRVVTKHLEILIGLWGHVLLHCRSGMCLMCHCYKWVRQLVEGKVTCARWHYRARDELIGLACCWPVLRTSLKACIAPTLLATDATLSKAGGVVTDLTPQQAVAIWSRQRWNRIGLSYQGSGDDGDLHTPLFCTSVPLYKDECLEEALQTLQFREIFRYRFRERKHINVQEMISWRTGIKNISRQSSLHDCKVLCLLDSQVVSCSVRKGRSTSHSLNALLQTTVGTSLLAKLDIIPLWISSEANAADDPTRVSHVRKASEKSVESERFWRCGDRWEWPLEATIFEWHRRGFLKPDGTFDATLGYPGEGPPKKTKRLLAPHASKEVPDLRLSVQPVTAVRYGVRIRHFAEWLQENRLPSLAVVVQDVEQLNRVLVAYLQRLALDERPVSWGNFLLAGLQQWRPDLHGKLHPSWHALRQWSNRFVPAVRRPIPVELLLSLAVAASLKGWWRMSVSLLLGFHLLLRPAELAGLRRLDILLPHDLGGSRKYGIVRIVQSKTSTRFTLLQAVTIEDEKILSLLAAVIQHDLPRSPLLPGGLAALQTRFVYLMTWLGCRHSGFTLASLRSGGALSIGFALPTWAPCNTAGVGLH
eukprot:2357183-Amphidinium_carterae.1